MANGQTHQQLLETIKESQQAAEADGTITTREMRVLLGSEVKKASRQRALETIHDLVEAGKLRPERVVRQNIMGRMQPIDGYRIVDDEEPG